MYAIIIRLANSHLLLVIQEKKQFVGDEPTHEMSEA